MGTNEDLAHADEIAAGMRQRCVERIRESDRTIVGVVFSSADVLYLLDAYDEIRAHCLGIEPSRGVEPESPDSPLNAPESPATDTTRALARLADLEAQRLAALEELSRIHRERCEVVRGMRKLMGPQKIAEMLGVSRQAVQKLLRG